jgi:ABC-2 type transport system permease protein
MSRPVSRAAVIAAILRKDLREFSRNKLFVYLTLMGLVAYAVMFWLLPDNVDETITLGIHPPGMKALIYELAEEGETEEGLNLVEFGSVEELRKAVAGELELEEEVRIGIDFPRDFFEKVATGQQSTVWVYIDPAVPVPIRGAMSSLAREIAFAIVGDELPVTEPDEENVILGEDRVGAQIPLREKMRPVLAYFVLMMEALALAWLLASEVQSRALTAILVTPAKTGDMLAAKGIQGTALAFAQAVILLIAIGGFGNNPLPVLTALLLGAVMVTGIGMIAGASGRDFLGTLFHSMAFLIPLAIPTFSVLFPGTASAWVKVMPSYGLVQTIVRAATYGAGWIETLPYLAAAAAWNVVILGAGLFILKRKVETL